MKLSMDARCCKSIHSLWLRVPSSQGKVKMHILCTCTRSATSRLSLASRIWKRALVVLGAKWTCTKPERNANSVIMCHAFAARAKQNGVHPQRTSTRSWGSQICSRACDLTKMSCESEAKKQARRLILSTTAPVCSVIVQKLGNANGLGRGLLGRLGSEAPPICSESLHSLQNL